MEVPLEMHGGVAAGVPVADGPVVPGVGAWAGGGPDGEGVFLLDS
jgi:hypothetical protein